MNRSERRKTEKYLGLTKHYKTLSRSAKFDLIAERITLGKQRQKETKERIEQEITAQNEARESKMIFTIAETIAKAKKIPVTDAMENAKTEFQTHNKTAI
jgi:hypothetical protein